MDREPGAKGSHHFPINAFKIVVLGLCLSLAVIAVFGYLTLNKLRLEFLHERARDILSSMESQVRGPGTRNNPDAWKNEIENKVSQFAETVEFIALLDGSGKLLAASGNNYDQAVTAHPGFLKFREVELYIFDLPLSTPRRGRGSVTETIAGWNLRLGLYTASADFIVRQATIQLAATGVAIAALLGLAYYFIRTLRRFLELKAREESERHLAALGGMAATLAHEIRNPLGAMKGLTQLAQEEIPAEHAAQGFMKTVVQEAERLEKLVTDLLTFARPKDAEKSDFDLVPLLFEIKDELQPKLESSKVSLVIRTQSDAVSINSDAHGLRQVLLNVLINAFDVTPEGGEIILILEYRSGFKNLVIHIDDSGPGLADRDPEEFFQPFTTTKAKGTGLGLAVSRQIINQLGGRILLGNHPQSGARCSIELPVERV